MGCIDPPKIFSNAFKKLGFGRINRRIVFSVIFADFFYDHWVSMVRNEEFHSCMVSFFPSFRLFLRLHPLFQKVWIYSRNISKNEYIFTFGIFGCIKPLSKYLSCFCAFYHHPQISIHPRPSQSPSQSLSTPLLLTSRW